MSNAANLSQFPNFGIINVRDSQWAGGADPTGTNDSSAAFNAAINSIMTSTATRGGTIHIPAGTYKLTSLTSIIPYAAGSVYNMYFEGDGQNNTVLNFSGNSGDGFQFNGSGLFFGIKKLTIQNATSNGINIIGSTNFTQFFRFEDIRIQNCGGSGFKSTNSFMGQLEGVWSVNNTNHGFEFDGFHTSIAFTRCWGGGSAAYPSGGNQQSGWLLTNMTYCSFQACGADFNAQNGYHCVDVLGMSFNGSGCESNAKEGWYVTTSSVGSSVTFAGCRGHQNSTAGIGSYANFVGAVTAGGLPIDILIAGGISTSNAAGDVHLVANGTSGTLVMHLDSFRPVTGTTLSSVTGTATVTDHSNIWAILYATCSSATTMTNNTDVLIPYAAVTDNVIGLSAGTYTVPVSGTYAISWGARVNTTAAGDAFGANLWVNNARYVDGSVVGGSGTPPAPLLSTGSVTLTLGGSTTLAIKGRGSPNSNNLNGSTTSNYFSVSRVS
jgi:hypothetical protein